MSNPFTYWNIDQRAPIVGYGETPPILKPNDPAQPQEMFMGYVQVFDLSKEEDLQKYNQVVDATCKGVCQLCREEVNFHEGKYVVYVRWMQRMMANPKQVFANAHLDEQGHAVFPRQSR